MDRKTHYNRHKRDLVGRNTVVMVVVMVIVGMVMVWGDVDMGVAMLYPVSETLYKHLDKEAG